MICGATRLRSARPRSHLSWPRPAPASGSGRRRPDRLRPRLPARPRRHRLEAQGVRLPFRALPRLAQNEERKCTGREARSRRRMGQKEMAMTGKNRIMSTGRRMMARTSSSSERPPARRSRSRSRGVRRQWSDTSKSACPTACSCRTFREEHSPRPGCFL